LGHTALAGRGRRVSTEHIDQGRRGAPASPLQHPVGLGRIVTTVDLGYPCGIRRRSQDMADLMAFGDGMQVSRRGGIPGRLRGQARDFGRGFRSRSVCVQ
jgi:hypothetical protein